MIASKYKDPRWQRRRLEVMQRDGWKCTACQATNVPLHVHHMRYARQLWSGDPDDLQTLCERCHEALGPHPRGGVRWYFVRSMGKAFFHRLHCPMCGSDLADGPDGERCAVCHHEVQPKGAAPSCQCQGCIDHRARKSQ